MRSSSSSLGKIDNESCNSLDLLTTPFSQDGSDGTGSALSDDPNKILVGVVASLVLRPSRDEGKVSRLKLVMSQFAPKALLDDECAGTGDCIDDGVLTALSENRTEMQPTKGDGGKKEAQRERGKDVAPTLLAVVVYGGRRMGGCCKNCPRVTTQFWARFQGEKTHPKHTSCHTYQQWQSPGWSVPHCPRWA